MFGRPEPQLAVALRLRASGHAVAFAVHPAVQPLVAGFDLEVLEGVTWGEALLKTPAQPLVERRPWDGGLRRLFSNLAQNATALAALIHNWRADVLVCDMLPMGPIAAEVAGIPYATTAGLAFPLGGSTLPPYGAALSPYARFGPRWLMQQSRWSALIHSGDRFVNRVRRAYGLPPVRRSLFPLSPYLALAFTTGLLEYKRPDLPPQVWFVGPALPPCPGVDPDALPDDWEDELPLVWADLRSLERVAPRARHRLLRRLIAGARHQPWRLVLQVQPDDMPARPRGLPSNVTRVDLPPGPVLQQSIRGVINCGDDVAVTAAATVGLPQLCLPFDGEQAEVAQRIVESGAGLRRAPQPLPVRRLRRAVNSLLNETGLPISARRLADDFARCDGPGVAADLLLQLAAARHPIHRALGQLPTRYAEVDIP